MRLVQKMALVGIALAALAGPVAAQEKFPSRPVKILVPYAPGGATDIVARVIAENMRTTLGQNVLVENKPGAFGIVAIEELARSRPDGYTLMVGNVSTNAITPILFKQKMSFDYEASVIPVTRLADLPAFLIATTKDFPPKTVPEFVAYAKQNSGTMQYATVGVGSFPHYDMIMFEKKAGLQLTDVPYKGGAGEAVSKLASGEVQAAFLNVATTGGMIRSGHLRPLAVVSSVRLPDYPDVPTMAEAGYPGIGTEQWQTLFARAGTPPEVLDMLFKAAVDALKSEQARKIFAPQYIRVIPSESPAEAATWLKKDSEHWRDVVRIGNLKVD
jgi:tripartite-type tricarboxylate transporter receptor subunit TctC